VTPLGGSLVSLIEGSLVRLIGGSLVWFIEGSRRNHMLIGGSLVDLMNEAIFVVTSKFYKEDYQIIMSKKGKIKEQY